jgi:hypothetical protein
MTSRNYFTNKKRLTKIDIFDSDNLLKDDIKEESFLERKEKEEEDVFKLNKIYKSLLLIKDKKAVKRIVNIINGKVKNISNKDINLIRSVIEEYKL